MTDLTTPRSESWFATLDGVLRGSFLAAEDGAQRAAVPVSRLLLLGLALGAITGLCLGSYSLFHGGDHVGLRIFANLWKVPLLFVLTVVVTLPSLYVFTALQRLPLDFGALIRLMLLSIVVNLCVVASLGPVFAFFAASTRSYPFLLLLNVLFFAIGGVLSLMVLHRAAGDAGREAKKVLTIWCLVYGIVGAQMGWLLRPFLGKPGVAFEWFCAPEDNVLIAMLDTIADLFR